MLLVAVRPVFFLLLVRAAGHPDTPAWEFIAERLPGHLVYAYMVGLAFWAVRKFAVDVRLLAPTLERLAPRGADAGRFFEGVTSTAGPMLMAAGLTVVLCIDLYREWGIVVTLVFLPYVALVAVPLMALFWIYISMLIGLDRLGRRPMSLDAFPQDPSLGLGPLGTRAFDAFLIFCAATVPFLLIRLRYWFDLAIGLTFFIAGVGAFFFSMWRLHRQMIETKRGHVATARALYAQAFNPVRPAVSLEALREHAPSVSAAESFEKRALATQEWPFDDRTLTRIIAIATGVVTAVIVRFVLRATGL